MLKKITVASVVIAVIIIISISLSLSSDDVLPESTVEETPSIEVQADVIMPTKVSRPGCEETDKCYIPSKITVEKDSSVTWINEDSAFHSVTSGVYDEPTGLFDSGYMDPYQTFSYVFDTSGTYDYYCTLHPWMEGKVIVE
ncbi:cupredoxin domain-containing protein [Nitrosopumilus sp.]|uniref:cupredoxin domain-containing protein n=1 Tax=Nitrosopumilus sp. TaxID=2024843 RepID=UPI003B592BD2